METKKWLCPTLIIVGLLVIVLGITNNNWLFVITGAIVLVAGLIICAGKEETPEVKETKTEEVKEIKPEPVVEPEVMAVEETKEEIVVEPVVAEPAQEDDGIEVAEEIENIEEEKPQM